MAYRRILAGWLAVLVLSMSVVRPAQAFAQFPLIGLGVLFENATMAGSYAAAIALVGTAVAVINVPTGEGYIGGQVRIDATLSPPTPEGWTPGTNGADPVPPGTAAGTPGNGQPTDYCARCASTGCGYVETCSACAAWASGITSYSAWCEVQGSTGGTYEPASCPTGYVSDGTTCVLSQPDQVPFPPDNRCDIGRGPDGVLRANPRDPDCPGSGVTVGGGRVRAPQGPNRLIVIDDWGNGTYTVTETIGNGNGTSTQNQYQIGQGGTLTGGTTGQVSGEGSAAPGAEGGVSGGGVGGTGNENGSGSCGGPGQAACRIDDGGFAGKDPIAGSAGVRDQAYGDRQSQVTGSKDGALDIASFLPSLMPSAYSVECRPLSVTMGISHGPGAGLSATEAIDICDKVGVVREYMGWLVSALTAFYLWGVFTRTAAPGGSKG